MKFRATLDLAGKSATGITVPEDVLAALGSGRRPAVRVTLRKHTFRTTVGTVDGLAKIPVSAVVRAEAGVAAGDELDVDIALDDQPREVSLPADLAGALDADPGARAFYDGLSYSKRNAYVVWVESAKKPETRERRVAEAAALLAAGRAQR
jgi:hypothetical protein